MSGRRASKRINLNRNTLIRGNSSAVASEAQATQWERNIEEFVRQISITDDNGYFRIYELFVNNVLTTYQTYSDGLINALAWAAPAAAWPARPGRPPLVYQAHYNFIMNEIDTHDATMVGAGAAPPGFDPTEAEAYRPTGPTPVEYDQIKWQILECYGNSGMTGLGDYTQVISFKVNECPSDPAEYHTVPLSDFETCLPEHVTHMRLGRFYANMISQTLKDNDIMLDWGRNHGCPENLNHLSFPAWDYVTDKRLISNDARKRMSEVTQIALRDKDKLSVEDPLVPLNSNFEEEFRVQFTANQERQKALSRERINHTRLQSFGGFRFPKDKDGDTA